MQTVGEDSASWWVVAAFAVASGSTSAAPAAMAVPAASSVNLIVDLLRDRWTGGGGYQARERLEKTMLSPANSKH
ncbi:hypothetical protein GCM10027199_03950 [Amycolatopsis magusensis]